MINNIRIKGIIIHNINIRFDHIEEHIIEIEGDLSEYKTHTEHNTLYIKTASDDLTMRFNRGPIIDSLHIILPNAFCGSFSCESLDSDINLHNIENHFNTIAVEGLRNLLTISNGHSSISMEGLNSKIFSNNVSGSLHVEGLRAQITLVDNVNISIKLEGLSSTLIHNNNVQKNSFGTIIYQTPFIHGQETFDVRADGLSTRVTIEKGSR